MPSRLNQALLVFLAGVGTAHLVSPFVPQEQGGQAAAGEQSLGEWPAQEEQRAQLMSELAPELDPLEGAQRLSGAVEELVGRIGPAVLSVRAERESGWGYRPLRRGSGVIVDPAGYALTNHHVVEGADRIRVSFDGRPTVTAEVVGSDPETDIAVLRVPGATEDELLPHAPLSNTLEPGVGAIVLAMGNPRGLDRTVTLGIVSGSGRGDLGIAHYEDFIQTDAAINPGNSGGPLVDLTGEVIGINTAAGIESEGSLGIGFAVPALFARDVLDNLLDDGRVQRGYLGVESRELRASDPRLNEYDGDSRVVIRRVVTGSPADRAGLRVGDIVDRIDALQIESRQDLVNASGLVDPGQVRPVVVWRDGQRLSIDVEFGERRR
ncbi:MAG: S1C family serine protease [Planctomycetota bacterium]|jgi:S1-C subfamily serine protease